MTSGLNDFLGRLTFGEVKSSVKAFLVTINTHLGIYLHIDIFGLIFCECVCAKREVTLLECEIFLELLCMPRIINCPKLKDKITSIHHHVCFCNPFIFCVKEI